MAPEVLNGVDVKANPAIDIWALGCMLYCMVFFKYPFNGETAAQVRDKIINQELRLPRDHAFTEELGDLLKGILCKDATKRADLN